MSCSSTASIAASRPKCTIRSPLHLQDALKYLGYKVGDFPIAERHCREVISFPVDQHLSHEEQDYVLETVREFYAGKRQ